MAKPKERFSVVGWNKWDAPPKGARIRRVITETVQHGQILPASKSSNLRCDAGVMKRYKSGIPPLALRFTKKGPAVLICTSDKKPILIPARNERRIKLIFNEMKTCIGKVEHGMTIAPSKITKCAMRTAEHYKVKPIEKGQTVELAGMHFKGRKLRRKGRR